MMMDLDGYGDMPAVVRKALSDLRRGRIDEIAAFTRIEDAGFEPEDWAGEIEEATHIGRIEF